MPTAVPVFPPSPRLLACPERLDAVARLRLPGHANDPHLDAAVQTVAAALGVPIAVVNLAAPGMQTFPAEVGVGAPCTNVPDHLSLCVEVIESGRPMHLEDASTHPRYKDSPPVRAGFIRAYAGVPLMHGGHVVGALSVFDDRSRRFDDTQLEVLSGVARLVEAVLSLRAASAWDPLTGLAARPLLLDRAERAMARSADSGRLAAVAVLDVRGMSEVNLRHGSAVGDAVLCAVADRVADAVGRGDSVARLGGDEFGVVLEDVASVEEARARAAELVHAVRGQVSAHGQELAVEVGCGVATTPAHDADALLAAAESAAGPDARHVAGSPAALASQRGLELRRGLEGGEFVLHYQPIVDLDTNAVHSAEALVRWQHPDLGLLPPSEFIPDAEHTGHVVELGTMVLRRAAEQIAAWSRAGRALPIAVNLSPQQMAGTDFVRTVAEVLRAAGAPAELLVLEITESSVMDEPSAPAALSALRDLGVRLALDDFGTGYSSLSYLRRFPVDTIKIDRSFVAGLGVDADDDAIVASVVSLAARVEKDVIAEGVETQEQAQALRALGVRHAQGYLWSRPLAVDRFEAWLATRPAVSAAPGIPAQRIPPPAPSTDPRVEARIWSMHARGASLHTIAAALNAEGSRTDKGVRWHTRTVAAVVAAAAARRAPA